MDFTEVINKRRTNRQWLDKEVDFETIKRILEAGNKAPTWDHHRSWQYIVLRTDEEKEYAFEHAKKIAGKFNAERYLNAPRPELSGDGPLLCCFPNNWKFFIFN